MNSSTAIAQVSLYQIMDYNYIYPLGLRVSARLCYVCWLNPCQGNSVSGPPQRTLPYRNPRIIAAIQDSYFSGGSLSVAHRYSSQFPTFQRSDGVVVHEVPKAMLALAATAVSPTADCKVYSNIFYQVYDAIYDWQTGEYMREDFSTDRMSDAYNGNLNTIRLIEESHNGAFHFMMADVFSQAR